MTATLDTFEARFQAGPWRGRREVDCTETGDYPEVIQVEGPFTPTAFDLLSPSPRPVTSGEYRLSDHHVRLTYWWKPSQP